jgi:ribulose-phosphate 3-epimerase
MSHLVAPSFLAADFSHVKEEVGMINNSEADWLHLDVMDGRFVPNITFGFPVLKAIQQNAELPLDVHTMLVEVDPYIPQFAEVGTDILTFHYETATHLHRTVQRIKNHNMQVGVALNPHTSVHVLEHILPDLDLVLLMSVNPGFGGQAFIDSTYEKVRQLRHLLEQKQTTAYIEVDGGVNLENAARLLKAGADVLVAGSAVFKSDDPPSTIKQLKTVQPKKIV